MQTERNTELMFQNTKSTRLVTDYPTKPEVKQENKPETSEQFIDFGIFRVDRDFYTFRVDQK